MADRDHLDADVDRRLAGMLRLGVVEETDLSRARARVQVLGAPSDWLPWLAHRAGRTRSWDAPVAGEQVLLAVPDGELRNGIILGSLYQASRPAPATRDTVHLVEYDDGAVIEYDEEAHRLRAELPSGGTVEVHGDMTLSGRLTVQGDIQAGGQVADGVRSMAADRALFNGHIHTAPSGGTSPPSVQQ